MTHSTPDNKSDSFGENTSSRLQKLECKYLFKGINLYKRYRNKHKDIHMLYIKPGIENAETIRKAYLITCSFLSLLQPVHQHK